MEQPNVPADTVAALVVVGAFAKVLPPLAAFAAMCWYGIQIWQSETGRGWRRRWKRVLRPRTLTIEDRIAFVVLGLGAAGVFMGMMAVGRLVQ